MANPDETPLWNPGGFRSPMEELIWARGELSILRRRCATAEGRAFRVEEHARGIYSMNGRLGERIARLKRENRELRQKLEEGKK